MTQRREPCDDLPGLRTKDGARKFADLSRAVTTAFGSHAEASAAPSPAQQEGSDIPEVPKWPVRSSAAHEMTPSEIAEIVESSDGLELCDGSPVAEPHRVGDDPARIDGEVLLREASRRNRDASRLRRAAEQLNREVGPEVGAPGEEKPSRSMELPEELKSFCRWVGRLGLSLARAALAGGRFAASTLSTYVLHHPVHFVFNVAITLAILVLVATGAALNDELISLKLGDRTAAEITGASRFTRNHSLTEIEKRGTREFMRAGAPGWIQHESIKAIIDGARAEGLSLEHLAVLLATAEIESGFNPMAQAATTTACGIFQFIKSTGATFGLKNSDCLDPWKSTEAEISHYRQNYAKRIEERVAHVKGPEKLLRMFELSYYLHHDGPLSKDPSDELKATVLAGAPFLFKVYDVLKADDELRSLEPTFLEHFKDRVDGVIADAKIAPGKVLGPVVAWMRPVGAETDIESEAARAVDGAALESASTAKPKAKRAPEAAARAVAKPTPAPTVKAAPKTAAKTTSTPAVKSVAKPAAKPAAKPVAKPTAAPVDKASSAAAKAAGG